VPFLRFSRDKRGYDTTALMHSFRGRGDARPRLLYWYRTPPDVKVGRAAIDEEAIRALEESNPELTFDWSRILHSHARPQPPDRKPDRRGESRSGGRPSRPSELAGPVAPGATPPAPSHVPERRAPETPRTKSRRRRQKPKGGEAGTSTPAVEIQTSGDAEETPAAPAGTAAHGSALEAIGHEDLARLRAGYAEIRARISQRVTDPQRLEKLRALAEQLNPDAWVTPNEVASGLAEFEAVHDALKSMLGRRRRRSRRGGVRHRRGELRGPAGGTSAPPATEVSRPEPDSESGTGDDPSRCGPPDEE
jgi:hypothetical protein